MLHFVWADYIIEAAGPDWVGKKAKKSAKKHEPPHSANAAREKKKFRKKRAEYD
jgi:hypothetical protein